MGKILVTKERELGPKHLDIVGSLEDVAKLYHTRWVFCDAGRFSETEKLYKSAFAIRKRALDPNHPDIARSLDCLGDLYSYYWEDKRAANFDERALLIWKRALGLYHPKIAISLLKFAQHYSNIGTHGKPEETKRFCIIMEAL